jgi:hypothetical protein
VLVDIWKCVATRRVATLVNVVNLGKFDQMLLELRTPKQRGQQLRVDISLAPLNSGVQRTHRLRSLYYW